MENITLDSRSSNGAWHFSQLPVTLSIQRREQHSNPLIPRNAPRHMGPEEPKQKGDIPPKASKQTRPPELDNRFKE